MLMTLLTQNHLPSLINDVVSDYEIQEGTSIVNKQDID